MGRSVSSPHNASAVAYQTIEVRDEDDKLVEMPDEHDLQWAFESLVEDLQEYAPTLWPSLRKCDEWLGREDHALLENDLAYMGISEYCGLVAVWIVPRTDRYGYESTANLCEAWCAQIEAKFLKTFGTLRKLGTMSNGESVFKRVEKEGVAA